MKLYGHQDEGLPVEKIITSRLAEVTLCGTPAELRLLAEFLNYCATEMMRMGEEYDHIHLSDQIKQFQNSPHFVVARLSE